ncbi:MAG: D-alanine--D-alanine ligase, partial [bacterium]
MKIIVLCGGLSMERDVSLKSGAQICRALRENGHEAVLVDAFFGFPGDPAEVFSGAQAEQEAEISAEVPDLEALMARRGGASRARIGENLIAVCQKADLVFLGLHGADGEDGRLQALFDIYGIRYTGSGHLASALAMDKAAAKELFRAG